MVVPATEEQAAESPATPPEAGAPVNDEQQAFVDKALAEGPEESPKEPPEAPASSEEEAPGQGVPITK